MDNYPSILPNVIAVSNPLPNPTTFVKGAYDLAYPQILAYCSALIGILTVVLIIRAVSKGG